MQQLSGVEEHSGIAVNVCPVQVAATRQTTRARRPGIQLNEILSEPLLTETLFRFMPSAGSSHLQMTVRTDVVPYRRANCCHSRAAQR
jgi:hypothetical protein